MLKTKKDKMTIKPVNIVYQPNTIGLETVADGEAWDYVTNLCDRAKKYKENGYGIILDIITSQELVVIYFRVAIKKGLLPYEDVEFQFKKWKLTPDKNGTLDNFPPGFCNYIERACLDLLR